MPYGILWGQPFILRDSPWFVLGAASEKLWPTHMKLNLGHKEQEKQEGGGALMGTALC